MLLLENDILTDCKYIGGGISKLWFANYSDDFDMNVNYDIDNPIRVSGFSESQIFYEIHVEPTIDNIEQIQDVFNNVWNKKLTFTLPRRQDTNSKNIDTISKCRFVIVYKDANGNFWLSGFDRGYLLRENIHRTEASGGRNAYGIVYEEQSRYQDRQLAKSAIDLFEPPINFKCSDYYSITMDSDTPLQLIADCIVGDFD